MTVLTDAERELLRPYVPDMLVRWPVDEPFRTVTGTLVSADISGFTALSERLASRGREGAEELTNLINSCFDGMIEDCHREGGDVLKFGGDALLVFFDGERHVERASRASVAMRRTIGRPRRTGDGKRVRLAVSIGVHAGEHTFFVVRNGHHELLVTGPGVTSTVDAESAARAGDVLLSAATAAQLPASWLGAATPDGVLLRRAFGSPSARADAPTIRSAEDFIPPEQQAQILAGAVNEHRQVSIAFLEFAGTDSLGAHETSNRLQSLANIVWAACDRFGVFWLTSDVYHDGGKFILTAGAPISRGGDEDRMLHAIREIVDADPGLNLRAGVNRGYVFAGDLGSARRRTYTTMGDATNLAARLMAKAASGDIVASRPMLDSANSNVESTPLEPFMVKGKSSPILASKVHRLLGTRAPLALATTPMIGRDNELEQLLGLSDLARSGHGEVVVLVGEPGSGKSRLAHELVRQRPDMRLGYVACEPYDLMTPFAATTPVMRTLLDIGLDIEPGKAGQLLGAWIDQHLPALRPYLPLLAPAFNAEVAATAESDEVAPQFRRGRTVRLATEVAIAAVRLPSILLIDNAQYLDDASAELVDALSGRVFELPLLIVELTTNPARGSHSVIPITALDRQALVFLANAALGSHQLTARDIGLLVDRSGGNPLFLNELIETAKAGESIDAVPFTIDAVIGERIDALAAGDRVTLRHASVLGTTVDLEVLRQVTGDETVRRPDRWDHLAYFVEHAGPGSVRFRHDMYRIVAYQGLSFGLRRATHRRAAEALAASVDLNPGLHAALAEHCARGGDTTGTWLHGVAAAQLSFAQGSTSEAVAFYKLAFGVRSVAASSDVLVMAEQFADVAELAAEYAAAERALIEVKRLAPTATARARADRKRAVVRERLADYASSMRTLVRARRSLGRIDSPEHIAESAAIDVAEAAVRYRQGKYRECRQLAMRAADCARTSASDHTFAHALQLVELACDRLGVARDVDIGDALEAFTSVNDLVGQISVLINRGIAAYFAGRWSEAAELYGKAQQLSSRVGDVSGEANAANNLGEILSDQGHIDAAIELFVGARRAWLAADYGIGGALALSNLGRAKTRAGERFEALTALAQATDDFQRFGAEAFVLETRLRTLECLVSHDLIDEATALWDELEGALRKADEPILSIAHARIGAWLAAGTDRRGAVDRIDASIDNARRAGALFELAQSLELRSQLASDDRDTAEAADIYRRLGVVFPPTLPARMSPAPSGR